MRSLREKQRISYDLEQDNRGKMSAVNLKDAEDATTPETGEAQPAASDLQPEPANDRQA